MAQNLKINNKDYNGVSIIAAPNANGGTAKFYDTSNASADASDIAAGKTAYIAGGKVTGTGGGGGGGTLGTKTITSNGTYDAIDDGYDGYSQVTANVPASAVDSGTKSITTNGTHDVIGYASANVAVPASAVDTGTKSISTNGTHDVIGYANASVSVPASAVDSGTKSITSNGSGQDVIGYAAVDVNVPNTYSASDEGKVVSSGALVAQTAHADVTPTTSDQTIDTTTNNSIKVKGDADLVAGNIKKDVEIFGVTGSYEGGGGGDTWQRPADWPNYDALNIASDRVVYITYDMSLIDYPFCAFTIYSGGTSPTLDIGYFSGTTFNVLETHTLSNSWNMQGFSLSAYKNSYDYIVARFTWSTSLSKFVICPDGSTVTINGRTYKAWSQPVVEVYGNILTAGNSGLFNGFMVKQRSVKSITLKNITLTADSSFEAFCSSCDNCERVYIDTTDNYKCNCYNILNGARNLYDVVIPKMKPTNLQLAFNACSRLQSVDLSKWDFSEVNNITQAFNSCYILSDIKKTSITFSAITNANAQSCFRDVPYLKGVTITASATNYSWGFANSAVELSPTSIKSATTNISNMYRDRMSVTGILDMSSADMSGITSGSNAFQGTSYTGFIMPSSLSTIYSEMFSANFGCREYHFKSTSPPTLQNTNAFSNIPSDCIIYVPQGSLSAYQTASNWSTYASYMQEEPS